jgi:hypothetical protein
MAAAAATASSGTSVWGAEKWGGGGGSEHIAGEMEIVCVVEVGRESKGEFCFWFGRQRVWPFGRLGVALK